MKACMVLCAILAGSPARANEGDPSSTFELAPSSTFEMAPSSTSDAPPRSNAAVIAGLSLFGTAYTPMVFFGGSALVDGRNDQFAALTLLPVLGAFVVGGETIRSSYGPDRAWADVSRLVGAATIVDGCAQAIGLTAALVGALGPRRPVESRLTVAPAASRGGFGLTAVGRF